MNQPQPSKDESTTTDGAADSAAVDAFVDQHLDFHFADASPESRAALRLHLVIAFYAGSRDAVHRVTAATLESIDRAYDRFKQKTKGPR